VVGGVYVVPGARGGMRFIGGSQELEVEGGL